MHDVNKRFDTSVQKDILELATRLATAAHQESEWQRRLTSPQLNQTGRPNRRQDLEIKSQVWFYKPPDQAKAAQTGRKLKHLAHYHGPATVTAKIGSSSYQIDFLGKSFQREAGMLVPHRDMPKSFEINEDSVKRKPRAHHKGIAFREGEFILTKDGMSAPDWYCAEVSKLLPNRIEVNYYTTITPALDDYASKSLAIRTKSLENTTFLRTWYLTAGDQSATTIPPKGIRRTRDIYSGRIPLNEVDKHVLIRNVRLTGLGVLDPPSTRLAATLPLPHHTGAGGDDDFEL